ncbi:MAG: alpha/beta hydrolase [Lachnospiraceae bacterium]|nr:alpha/beta hydrolase [Lachnospiraceae bacterium]
MIKCLNLIESESDFKRRITSEAVPYLSSSMERGTFESFDGSAIAYRRYKNPAAVANILIIHGFSEFMEKYNEMICVLLHNGFEVYATDLRGHGDSVRTADDPSKVNVDDFDQYIDDIRYFYQLKLRKSKLPNYLLGHSMGGAVAILYAEKYPEDFSRIVFSSPMARMKVGKFPFFVVETVSFLAKIFGKGMKFAAGQGPFNPASRLAESSCKSEARYEYIMDMRRGDVKNQTWSGTYNWVLAACRASRRLMKKKNIARITAPAIVLGAGHDRLVDETYIRKFAESLPNGKYIFFPESRHEIYHGAPEERVRFYEEVINFLNP